MKIIQTLLCIAERRVREQIASIKPTCKQMHSLLHLTPLRGEHCFPDSWQQEYDNYIHQWRWAGGGRLAVMENMGGLYCKVVQVQLGF